VPGLTVGVGVTIDQFAWFFRQSEEQISMVILEASANQVLYKSEEEEPSLRIFSTIFFTKPVEK
jgi:hypothetical protein